MGNAKGEDCIDSNLTLQKWQDRKVGLWTSVTTGSQFHSFYSNSGVKLYDLTIKKRINNLNKV